MAIKTKVSEWDSVAGNNILINGININENCPPSAVNNAIREMMAQIKDWQSGASGDDWTSDGTLNITGSLKLDGNLGSSGQVIESQGSTATPKWKTLGTMSAQNSSSVTTGDLNITGALRLDSSLGSNGQVLRSLGSTATPIWTTLGTMSGQNYNNVNITGGSVNVSGSFKLDNSTGTAGQVMLSTGSSATPVWGDAFIKGMIMLWTGSTAPSGWAICNGSNGTPDLRDKFVMGAGGSKPASGGYFDTPLPVHSHTGTTNNGGAKTISSPVTLSGSTGSAGAQTLSATTNITDFKVDTKTGLDGTLTLKNRDGTSFRNTIIPASTGSVTRQMMTGSYGEGWKGDSGSQSSKAIFALNHSHTGSAKANTTVTNATNHTHSLTGKTGSATVTIPNHTHTFTTANAGATSVNGNLPPYYALAYIMKL